MEKEVENLLGGIWSLLDKEEKDCYVKTYRRYKYLKGISSGNVTEPNFLQSKIIEECEKILGVRKSSRLNKIDYSLNVSQEVFYCEVCKTNYLDYCLECGMLVCLIDNPVPTNTENRAPMTVPKKLVEIRTSEIHGLGAFTLNIIPQNTRMGPYQGVTSKKAKSNYYEWSLSTGQYVDSSNVKKSNWMRYVNCARNTSEQNLEAFEHEKQIYYKAMRRIEVGEELLVYYGDEYARLLNIDVTNYKKEVVKTITKAYECVPCGIGFSNLMVLEKHKMRCRSKSSFVAAVVFPCDFCCIGLGTKEFLEKHMATCNKNPNLQTMKKYQCGQCTFSTDHSSSLKIHELTHSDQKAVLCEFCGKSYGRKDHLARHISCQHTWRKEYQCDSCEFSFGQKYMLEDHKRVHCGQKVYICQECMMGFNSKRQLEAHESKHGSGAVPKSHRCQLCDYESVLKGNVTRHTAAVHDKEKNFYCDQCDFKSVTGSNLKKHLIRKHRV